MKKISLIITLAAFFFSAIYTNGQGIKRTMKVESDFNSDFSKSEIYSFFSQDDDEDKSDGRRRARRRFHPHWTGFEIGPNGFLSSDFSTSLPAGLTYLDLNTGKSYNVNINFAQLGLGFSRHFGIVTGLGFEFNNYRFDNNNNITKDDQGVVGPFYPAAGIVFEKSKLATVYFTMPLMLELHIPVKYHSTINIAGGMIGGVKLGSHNKMVFDDGGKQKVKEKNDFSLNVLRYGPTVRIGYENFQIYITYYMNGLFKENKGPDVYPAQIGIAFTFSD